MHIRDTRKCNMWNLERIEAFLETEAGALVQYYEELIDDRDFIDGLNERVRFVRREHGFTKGIFRKPRVPSIDWFAFERVLLYVLTRHLKPAVTLETGVYYGGNTAFLLNGLHKNRSGKLISIDYPDSEIREDDDLNRHPYVGETELYQRDLQPGFIIPEYLLGAWDLLIGDSHAVIPTLEGGFDLYLHDSEHSYDFARKEMSLAMDKMTSHAVAVVDDIDWSNAFFSICDAHRLYPLCLTDNGKDDLRLRTGVVKLDHPKNRIFEITGAS